MNRIAQYVWWFTGNPRCSWWVDGILYLSWIGLTLATLAEGDLLMFIVCLACALHRLESMRKKLWVLAPE